MLISYRNNEIYANAAGAHIALDTIIQQCVNYFTTSQKNGKCTSIMKHLIGHRRVSETFEI